jgi:hypothetical protein
MNEKIEQRLADLEKAQAEQGKINDLLMAILARYGDDDLSKTALIIEAIITAQDNNERFFEIVGTCLPQEIRPQFETVLNHSKVHRDQMEAALEQLKNRPKISEVLKGKTINRPDPPAAPQPPPA